MKIAVKAVTVLAAGLVTLSLTAFAPVPNTTEYHGDALYSEDGSTAVAHVNHHKYEVAFIPVSKAAKLADQKIHYYAAIAILNTRGKILYYRHMSTPKAVNAFGKYYEQKHTYKSLHNLKLVLDRDIKSAHNSY